MNSLKIWITKHYLVVVSALFISFLLGLFSLILEEVYENDPKVVTIDNNISSFISSTRTLVLNDFFLLITQLGNTIPVLISFIFAVLFFFTKKKFSQLAIIVLSMLGCGVISFVIKEIVQRARPLDGLIVEHGFSFPSGHAFIGVCFWAVLFYLFSTLVSNRILKIALITVGIVLAILIGFSRVYIGVHWPSDVVASYLLSTVYVLIVIWLVNNKQKLLSTLKIVRG